MRHKWFEATAQWGYVGSGEYAHWRYGVFPTLVEAFAFCERFGAVAGEDALLKVYAGRMFDGEFEPEDGEDHYHNGREWVKCG